MNTQTEQPVAGTPKDTALLLAAMLAGVGGVVGFYYFAGQFPPVVRVLMVLGGIAAAAALAYQTLQGKTLWGYIQGSRVELRKTTWPTRQESVQTTLMIAVVVLIAALILWGFDSALLWGVKGLTGRG